MEKKIRLPGKKLGARTSIDPRLLKNPWNGMTICASFKSNMKARSLEENITTEMLLADRSLFEEFLCQNPPELNRGHKNGRCALHGNRSGRPTTTGKYSNHFTPLSIEELAEIQDNRTLDAELTVLSKQIRDKLEETNNNTTPSNANLNLLKLARALRSAMDGLDIAKIHELIDKIIKHCEDGISIESAKKDVAQLIETYSRVMNVAIKERALNAEYKHMSDVYQDFIIIFSIVVNEGKIEGKELNAARSKVEEFILGRTQQSGDGTHATKFDLRGPEDKDSQQGINILPPE